MFKIDKESNSIVPLTLWTFGELGFRERSNLQEWIAKQPSCLGEELLVIVGFVQSHPEAAPAGQPDGRTDRLNAGHPVQRREVSRQGGIAF
jgi:hypothetical protein